MKCYDGATGPNALTHFATIYINIAIISNVGWGKSHEKNFFLNLKVKDEIKKN